MNTSNGKLSRRTFGVRHVVVAGLFIAFVGATPGMKAGPRALHTQQEGIVETPAEERRATEETLAAVERFNDAFNAHNVDSVMAAMTDDCVFEDTSPAPDGTRIVGQAAVRAYWEKFFADYPTAHFGTEDMFAAGDRCVVQWVYTKLKDGVPWHLRGVDIFRVRDGRVAQKLSYVKG